MNKKNIVVIGKTGQLAQEILRLNLGWTFLDRTQCDLEKTDLISTTLDQLKPTVIINAAAYTKVDLAEDEKVLCQKVNLDAVAKISHWCANANAKLVHVSTDYVFDGAKNTPYVETDKTSPLNYYGLSKLLAEEFIAKSGCKYTILRTSWIYSDHGQNFLKTMQKLIPQRDLNVVFDQVGTPTAASDLAQVIQKIVDQDFFTNKTYHYSHEGVASWYDFAQMIKQLQFSSSKNVILPILSSQYPQKAKRPAYSVMNKQLLKNEMGITILHWSEALAKYLKS